MKCENCGKIGSENEIRRCSKCLMVRYCGKLCQRKHWHKEHKNICFANKQKSEIMQATEDKVKPETTTCHINKAMQFRENLLLTCNKNKTLIDSVMKKPVSEKEGCSMKITVPLMFVVKKANMYSLFKIEQLEPFDAWEQAVIMESLDDYVRSTLNNAYSVVVSCVKHLCDTLSESELETCKSKLSWLEGEVIIPIVKYSINVVEFRKKYKKEHAYAPEIRALYDKFNIQYGDA